MNDFVKGMSTIGQLYPPRQNYPAHNSAWNDTANSFRQAGNDLRHAMKEFLNGKPESKQTT